MKELGLLLMVFWPGGEDFVAQVQATFQDARAVWEAFADGNVCAFGNSLQRFLRNFGISITFAQGNCPCKQGNCRFVGPFCLVNACTCCEECPAGWCCLKCYGQGYFPTLVGCYPTPQDWAGGILDTMQACGCLTASFPAGGCGRFAYFETGPTRNLGMKECCPLTDDPDSSCLGPATEYWLQ